MTIPAPILNAKDVLLTANPGSLPDLHGPLLDWFQPLVFTRIVKTVVNFSLVETKTDYSFRGVRQPFTAQQLMMKPEGQRQWLWQTIHSFPDLVLVPDEIIVFAGIPYRVMQKLDWTEYGYVEYHVIQDYTG